MRAEEFVEFLAASMPSRQSLEEYGLDQEEILDVQSTFKAERLLPPEAGMEPSGPEIERLLRYFDCSRVQVGLIQFFRTGVDRPDGLSFARLEGDILVVRLDGTVWAYEAERPRCPCAVDSARFLDALGTFLRIRREKSVWAGRVLEAARACARAAGGSAYQPFYEELCGFLHR